ncbi:MAG: hypothetical protein Q4C01_06590 [Clostridia bacterium]|nr:hypothetical protein [Clostridia bacterium]
MRELRRVLIGKAALFCMAVLLLLQGFLYLQEQTSGGAEWRAQYNEAYADVLARLEGLEPAESLELLAELEQVADACYSLLVSEGENYEYFRERYMEECPDVVAAVESGSPPMGSDEAWAIESACKDLAVQVEYLLEYEGYYDSILENALRMEHLSIFSDPDSFSYKNIQKTKDDFAPIADTVVSLGDDRAITSLFDSQLGDFFIIIWVAVLCTGLLSERKNGLWHIVYAAKNGRLRLALKRVSILFIGSFAGVLLLFGSKVLLSFNMYDGFSQFDRSIQSIGTFMTLNVPMSVGGFVLNYFCVRVMSAFVIALFLYALLASVSNLPLATIAVAIAAVAEYSLYSLIPLNSSLVLLRYINIFQLISPISLFQSYLNVEMLGTLVQIESVVKYGMFPAALLLGLLCVLIHMKKRPVGGKNPILSFLDGIKRKTNKLAHRIGKFGVELYKVLIPQKGLAMLLVLVLIAFFVTELPSSSIPEEERYAPIYYNRYEGEVNDVLLSRIQSDLDEVMSQMNSESGEGSLTVYNSYQGISIVLDAAIYEAEQPNPYLVNPYPYERIIDSGAYDNTNTLSLIAVLMLCLMLSGVFAYEHQSNMDLLQAALPKGRLRLFLVKQLVTLAIVALVFFAVWGKELIYASALNSQAVSVQKLDTFSGMSINCTLGAFLTLMYGMRFAGLFATAQLILFISQLCRKVVIAQIVTIAVFVIPSCLVVLGSDQIFTLTPLCTCGFAEAYFGGKMLPLAIFLIIAALALSINCPVFTRRLKKV